MKTYTFNVNKNTKTINSSNNNFNTSAYIDNVVLSNLKRAIPYAFKGTIDEDYRPSMYVTEPKKVVDIDITIKKSPTTYTSLDFNKYTDFIKAIEFLSSLDNYDDSADFYLEDGTPVRIFEDEIQVGFTLIPLRKISKNAYDKLSKKNKKAIIDLVINISK